MIPMFFTLQVAGPSSARFTVDQSFQSCQVANLGISFVVTVTDENGNPVNLRTATALKLKFKAPDGTTSDKTASLYTNGMDGKLVFTTASAGDLAQVGEYWVQAGFTISGLKQSTRWGTFVVAENISTL